MSVEFDHFLLRVPTLHLQILKTPIHHKLFDSQKYKYFFEEKMWGPFFLSVMPSLLGELLEKLVENLFSGPGWRSETHSRPPSRSQRDSL